MWGYGVKFLIIWDPLFSCYNLFDNLGRIIFSKIADESIYIMVVTPPFWFSNLLGILSISKTSKIII